jgi:hypothetical protein
MIDQIGVAFPKGAPFVTELNLLRVVEFHCDFIAGRKVSLDNLILQNCQLHRSIRIVCEYQGVKNDLLGLSCPFNVSLSRQDHGFPQSVFHQYFSRMYPFNDINSNLVL